MPGTPYEQRAVRGVNLEIQQGEFVGILGHTGSGKSTLVQMMGGLLPPSAGHVTVDGIDINEKSERARAARRRIGIVFQYPEHQLFDETVYADVAFGPRNFGCSEEEIDRRVRAAMGFVSLPFDEYAARPPMQLSGGEKRRVAIAGVIALQPEYLILDEPAAGLDPRGREEIFAEVVKYFQQAKITVIMISHSVADVLRLARRILLMQQGQVVWDGPPAELLMLPQQRLAAAGIEAPPLAQVLACLRESGLVLPEQILTVDCATEAIRAAIGRRGSD